MFDHLIMIYHITQQKMRIPIAIDILSKVLRMRNEWKSNNCTGLQDAKDKNLYIMTLKELDEAVKIIPYDGSSTQYNNKVIERTIESLRTIKGKYQNG